MKKLGKDIVDTKETKTLCVGLEHFIDKIGYQAEIYSRNHEKIRYLVCDVSGKSEKFITKYNADVRIVPHNALSRIMIFLIELLKFRPKYVELYLTGKLSIIYAILSKFFFRKLIVIVRGLEFSEDNPNKRLNYLCCDLSNFIIIKEYNLRKSLSSRKYKDKSIFLPNAVPIDSLVKGFDDRKIDVIFLNSPRKSRNVLFLIDVFRELLLDNPELRIVIAGFSIMDNKVNHIEVKYQQEVLAKIKKNGLQKKIEIKGFVDNGHEILQNSKIFVFPADVVFCNYSLLEAMQSGCVPIVINGEGATEIIENGRNGIISTLDISTYATDIKTVLSKKTWERLSSNARSTIESNFSIEEWYNKLKRFVGK